MPDAFLNWGSDLASSPTGDLASASGATLGRQRVLRRLLTNPGDYVWQPTYGAGLGRFIGQPASPAAIRAAIRAHIFLEPAVARQPEPVIDIVSGPPGTLNITVRYADAGSDEPVSLEVRLPEAPS